MGSRPTARRTQSWMMLTSESSVKWWGQKLFPNRGVHGQVCRKVWPKAGDLKAPASKKAHTARLFFAFPSMTRTSHRMRAARASCPQLPCEVRLKGWHEWFQQLVNVLAKIDGRRSSNGLPTPIGPKRRHLNQPSLIKSRSHAVGRRCSCPQAGNAPGQQRFCR